MSMMWIMEMLFCCRAAASVTDFVMMPPTPAAANSRIRAGVRAMSVEATTMGLEKGSPNTAICILLFRFVQYF